MPRLHPYVSAELASEIARRAEAVGMSVSRFLAEVVRRNIGTAWPDGFFEDIVGGKCFRLQACSSIVIYTTYPRRHACT